MSDESRPQGRRRSTGPAVPGGGAAGRARLIYAEWLCHQRLRKVDQELWRRPPDRARGQYPLSIFIPLWRARGALAGVQPGGG